MTVGSLTQGRERQIDIDSILSFLDEEEQNRAYVRDWKKWRGDAAFLFRRFDVRVFEFPANAALAAVRIFGDGAAKKPLKLKSMGRATGLEAISKLPFVRALEGDNNLKNNDPADRERDGRRISANSEYCG
jgi:hypothetical protein